MKNNYPQLILEKINTVLLEKQKPAVNLEQVVFILGMNLLNYHKNFCMVSKSELISPDKLETNMTPLLQGGPKIIRAILMPMEDQRYLIELFFGPPKGSVLPEIIGNPDLRRTVKVVEI
ncbi:MAG: hypothetical protein HY036_05615 [Nitrospirae bacterium]|nr:hypothetical protein [Nitrospirota bacterium]MBI3352038.1 hypothetical protein [Nitrospirota bacterium]